jgi:ATP-binding cassette subfamily B protein
MSDAPSGPRQRLTSLRGLLPFLRPHRTLVAGWLLALAFSSSATLVLPWAFRQVVDQITHGGHGSGIDRWFLFLLGVAVLMAIATGARFFFVSLLGERVIADLRCPS